MHLVWEREPTRKIHIKPLPPYLLDSRFWSEHIVCNRNFINICACLGEVNGQDGTIVSNLVRKASDCQRFKLRKSAKGFLNSYNALIQHPSDFTIAQDLGLIPKSLEWDPWSSHVQNLLQDGTFDPYSANDRYRYGELSLSRLNKISFFIHGSFLRGYRVKERTSPEVFREHLRPITAMTVYIALVLTAMQVGLGTEKLQSNEVFQKVSYGFTVFAIVGPLALVFINFVFILGQLFFAFVENLKFMP